MNIFSFIKTHLKIVDVVERYSKLKRTGHYYRGVCPFHVERTPSFTVSPHKNIFYCFGCHAGGDVISFIAKAENCSQIEAAQHLIEHYKLEVPSDVSFRLEEKHTAKKQDYFTLCGLVAQWCHEKLAESDKAKNYLQARGIKNDSAVRFVIGYFPGGARAVSSLVAYLKTHNFLVQDLLEAKIIMEGKGSSFYSPFEERIMFPIYDHLGRCCGFGGRVFLPEDNRAKYYNSHENEFFIKGSLLYGFDKAKKTISRDSSVFLVEGYTDCIAVVQHGKANCVATLGTACTLEHLQQISRYAKKLYILFDGDQAGRNAIFRLTELCWAVDLDLAVVTLPQSADPASFLAGGGNLDELVAKAEDIFVFFISSLGDHFREKGLQDRLELTRKFMKTIGRIDDPLKQDFLIYRASGAFEVPADVLRREMNKLAGDGQAAGSAEQVRVVVQENKFSEIPLLEKKLFSGILSNISSLDQEDEAYLTRYLHTTLQSILNKIIAVDNKERLSFERIYEILDEDEKRWVSGLLLEWPCEDKETLFTLMRQFAKKQWKKMVSEFTTKIKYAQQVQDQQAVSILLTEFQELKTKLLSRGLI